MLGMLIEQVRVVRVGRNCRVEHRAVSAHLVARFHDCGFVASVGHQHGIGWHHPNRRTRRRHKRLMDASCKFQTSSVLPEPDLQVISDTMGRLATHDHGVRPRTVVRTTPFGNEFADELGARWFQALIGIEQQDPLASCQGQRCIPCYRKVVTPRKVANSGTVAFSDRNGPVTAPRINDHDLIDPS